MGDKGLRRRLERSSYIILPQLAHWIRMMVIPIMKMIMMMTRMIIIMIISIMITIMIIPIMIIMIPIILHYIPPIGSLDLNVDIDDDVQG